MQPKSLSAYVDYRRGMFDTKTDSTRPDYALTGDDIAKAMRTMGVHAEHLGSFKRGTCHEIIPFACDGEAYALRILADSRQAFSLHMEDWAANAAIEVGFPTIAPLITDTSRYLVPFDFQILPWVDGPSFEGANDDVLKEAFAIVAAHLARLHQISLNGYGPLDPRALFMSPPTKPRGLFDTWCDYLLRRFGEHLDKCLELGAMTPAEVEQAEDAVDSVAFDFAPTLLHGDLSNVNILTKDDAPCVIDWEDCLSGDNVWDLADWCAFHMPERWSWIIDAYYAHAKKPADFNARFWTYYLRIVVARTVQRAKMGKADNPAFPPASRRIQLALENLRKL